MKREEKKSRMPVPWDNMPRQAEVPAHHPKSSFARDRDPGTVDPMFSNVHAFFPFQANLSHSEEEK